MSPIRRMSRRKAAIFGVIATLILALPMAVLASHQFDDVPTDHLFHNDIDALADAGITGGCSADNYCPGSFVTRGQMAAFLNRLGALAPGKEPKVNADRLDGYDANEITRAALGTMTGAGTLTTSYQSIGSVTITAPAAGFVILSGSTTVYSFAAACGCEITVGLGTSATGDPDVWSNSRVGLTANAADIATISVPHVYSVAAGTHTFHMVAINHGAGTGLASATFGSLVAQFTPFGATGGPTIATTGESTMSTDTELSD